MSKARIVIETGPGKGQQFDVTGRLTVGRGASNTVRLTDDLISRSHAEIECQDGIFILRDLGSRNGTKVNGLPVTEKTLEPDDVITLGNTQLKFITELSEIHEDEYPTTQVVLDKESVTRSVVELRASSLGIFTPALNTADIRSLQEMGKNFQRLHQANQIIASEMNLNKVFERIVDQLFGIFPADRILIMVTEEGTEDLTPKMVRARDSTIDIAQIRISRTIAHRVITEAVGLVTSDAIQDERLRGSQSILAADIRSAMCAPLIHQGVVMGLIYMDTKNLRNAFGETDLRLLTGISGPATIAIRNARYMEMLGFVTHEMKSPLASVLMNLDVLLEGIAGDLTEKQRGIVSSIRRNVGYFEEMIKNYLDLSRIEKGELAINKADIDLRVDVIDPIYEAVRSQFAAKKMSVFLDVPPGIKLHADANLLKIVYDNFLSNAAKYGREGGSVQIAFKENDGRLRLSVRNEGEGIAPEQLEKLFRKFSRLTEQSKAKQKGSGLGLFICRQIVEKHGGKIWAESEVDKWAEFVFEIPKA